MSMNSKLSAEGGRRGSGVFGRGGWREGYLVWQAGKPRANRNTRNVCLAAFPSPVLFSLYMQCFQSQNYDVCVSLL